MSLAIENHVPLNLSQQLINNLPVKNSESLSFNGIITKMKYCRAISKQRKHLARLDERLLNDIGLTKEQVRLELAKPFWK
ncbi:MAG: DUF1127 domain-containing protein [Cocleimonas sp.]